MVVRMLSKESSHRTCVGSAYQCDSVLETLTKRCEHKWIVKTSMLRRLKGVVEVGSKGSERMNHWHEYFNFFFRFSETSMSRSVEDVKIIFQIVTSPQGVVG